jgi:hypothetical protein
LNAEEQINLSLLLAVESMSVTTSTVGQTNSLSPIRRWFTERRFGAKPTPPQQLTIEAHDSFFKAVQNQCHLLTHVPASDSVRSIVRHPESKFNAIGGRTVHS